MPEINQLILDKLKEYDPDVIELALKALEYADKNMEERTIAEQLENVVRQIVKKKGAGHDFTKA
jgi:hypothetical protein